MADFAKVGYPRVESRATHPRGLVCVGGCPQVRTLPRLRDCVAWAAPSYLPTWARGLPHALMGRDSGQIALFLPQLAILTRMVPGLLRIHAELTSFNVFFASMAPQTKKFAQKCPCQDSDPTPPKEVEFTDPIHQ